MSSEWNSSFPTIGLNVSEGRSHLTAKTMLAFRYVFENHVNDADWFLKADDDTYVIMENLRYFLSSYNTEDPIYFGHIFKAIVKGGYPSGGAGYILSKEALKRLGGPQGKNTSLCNTDGGAEDVQIGKCMTNLGVKLLPTVDVLGRSRFHCFGPEAHLQGRFPDWYYKYDAAGARAVCTVSVTFLTEDVFVPCYIFHTFLAENVFNSFLLSLIVKCLRTLFWFSIHFLRGMFCITFKKT